MADLLMSQTGRPHTGRHPSPPQPWETPSAPPWAPQQPAPPQPTLPHASTLYHQGAPPQLARAASAGPSSTEARAGGVPYPAVYSSSSPPSQQPSAGAVPETVGDWGPAARPGHPGGSDNLQAEVVQIEAPRVGYVPAAVSFMMGKLQVQCFSCHAALCHGCM